MIEIREFQENDLKQIAARDIFGPDVVKTLLTNTDPKTTICHGDKILSIIGATFLFKNVVEFWTVTSDIDTLRPYLKEYIRALRIAIPVYMEKMNLKRAHITVPDTFPTAKKWGHALGFTLEGVLKNYGWDNQDYYMFARYR